MKKKISRKTMQDLALRISILKNELLVAGLIETYHEIDSATKKIGWEISNIVEGNHLLVELVETEEKQ